LARSAGLEPATFSVRSHSPSQKRSLAGRAYSPGCREGFFSEIAGKG
jgi:hypothetical protein